MAVLYVTSSKRGIGKTLVCAGIARQMQKDGKKVGFLKPIFAGANSEKSGDRDAVFMKNILALPESVESICPLIGSKSDVTEKIKQAYSQIAQGKDVVIVEGMSIAESDEVAQALDALVLILEDYGSRLSIDAYKAMGKSLLGVMLNRVPATKMTSVSSEVSARLGMAGVNFLGAIPEDRVLFAITVAELAEKLRGKLLNSPDEAGELVESVMLGAMSVDSGLDYFGRKANKAVVVRGERPDMQMAALQTSTRCLVIGGGAEPIPAVFHQAENKKVPIISVKGNTDGIVGTIEDVLSNARFSQEKKLPRLAEVMGKQFNYQALYKGLGFAR